MTTPEASASQNPRVAAGFLARPPMTHRMTEIVKGTSRQREVVFAFTITGGKIAAIDLIADPERIGQLEVIQG